MQRSVEGAVNCIRFGFTRGSQVLLLSQGVELLAWPYQKVFGEWKTNSAVSVDFVPWSRAEKASKDEVSGQVRFLNEFLKLDGARSGRAEPLKLEYAQKRRLAQILVKQAEQASPKAGALGYFTTRLQSMNLPEPWIKDRLGSLQGVPLNDSIMLVNWANDQGVNSQRQTHSTLAELILVIVSLTGPDDWDWLMDLVKERRLVAHHAMQEFFKDCQEAAG